VTGSIEVVELGRRPYGEVLDLQRDLCRARVRGEHASDLLLLVEHDPVYTMGRSTKATSLPLPVESLRLHADVEEIERGGDVTWHGPGQLVAYPIIHLAGWRQDLHWYLRMLEQVTIDALAVLGIAADRAPGYTGAWAGGRKIASIGVHVKQWVTMHGLAVNVSNDLTAFDRIVPCGIEAVTMTSVARELGTPAADHGALDRATRRALLDAFGTTFERQMLMTDATAGAMS
jgi:lipoyl(octanoyl) transferase